MTPIKLGSIGLLLALAPISARALPLGSEIGTLQGFGHGKFEARAKFASGDGVVSTFFLWKDGSEMADVFWLEVDIEKIGASCNGYSSNALYGLPQQNRVEKIATEVDLCANYHTHTVEWTPEAVVWLLDGVELRRVTGDDVAAYNENGAEGMQMRFNLWVGSPAFGGTLEPQTLPVQQFISYAAYSSYTPGAGDNGTDFTLEWRDSFETAVGNEWLKGSWESPSGNSKHTAQNVQARNGAAVLSLTSEGTAGYDGEVPVDPQDLPSFKDGVLSDPLPPTMTPTEPTSRPPGATAPPGTTGGVAVPPPPAGTSSGSPTSPSAVPSPSAPDTSETDDSGCSIATPSAGSSSWGLLGLGLAALLRRRRKAVIAHPQG